MSGGANFIIEPVSDAVMPIIPAVGPHRVVKMAEKTVNFVNVKAAGFSDIYITSPVFTSVNNKVANGECIGYPILPVNNGGEYDILQQHIEWLEKTVAERLTTFLSQPNCSVNKPLKEIYLDNPVLRPTFRAGSNMFWAKLAKNCRAFNWGGESMKLKDMGPGRYQFVLRVNGIFVGHHGDSDYVASLNLRVIQLRHEPCEIEAGNIPQTCLMSDYVLPSQAIDDLWAILNTTPACEVEVPACPPAPPKKPTLQRQNAMPSGDLSTTPRKPIPSGDLSTTPRKPIPSGDLSTTTPRKPILKRQDAIHFEKPNKTKKSKSSTAAAAMQN